MGDNTSQESRPWSEFNAVDRSSESKSFVEYLDTARDVDSIEVGKRFANEQLRIEPGHRVLEIGCGTGDDSIRLGGLVGDTGSIVGVDFSESMVAEATKRASDLRANVSFEQGDAQNLRFEDNEFDSTRAERVFIHLQDPDMALRELLRVTKPGGRVVLMEPDLDKFAFDSRLPETGHHVSRAISSVAHNPAMGRSLRRRLIECGVSEFTVTPFVMTVTDYEVGRHLTMLDRLLEVLVENELASTDEAAAINEDLLRSHRDGTFSLYGPYYVASAVVPG